MMGTTISVCMKKRKWNTLQEINVALVKKILIHNSSDSLINRTGLSLRA